MRAQPAPEPGLDRGATLRNLWGLVRLSGPVGLRAVALSVVLAAAAATIDAASLALLRRTLDGKFDEIDAAIVFVLAALFGSVLRLIAQRATVTAQYRVNRALALRAFRALQTQDYAEYLRRGASEGFTTFERLQLVANFGVAPLIGAASALLSAVVILAGIALIYPLAAAAMVLALAAIAAETAWRSRTGGAGGLSQLARTRSTLLFEARTAFRHIFLANGQERMCEDFAAAETGFRGEHLRTTIASQSSRHMVEIAGLLSALAVLGAFSLRPFPGAQVVPLIAVTALATLRLLPQIAALRSAARLIAMHADVSHDVLELLERPLRYAAPVSPEPVVLRDSIVLTEIHLSRADRPVTLAGLELTIARGSRIGIRGESGIGKSSLLDVLCGAVRPDRGEVRIDGAPLDFADGRAWRERIGVVSQNPVLLGQTLREAVIFPERVEEVDSERFAMALAAAGIDRMVAEFPSGLDTAVGEASTLLSGGQRQRIALAHALYRARDLLVLDEATGQLDPDSEAAIVAAVAALPRDLTIVAASHRPAIFACCDVVYQLREGKLVR